MPVVKKQGSLSVQSFNRDQTERGRFVRRYRCEGPTATEDHRFKGEIHFRDEVTLEKPIIDLRAAEDGNASPVVLFQEGVQAPDCWIFEKMQIPTPSHSPPLKRGRSKS